MDVKKHFSDATLIEKIGEDGISFEIYRILIPDEDDPDFEQEYLVVYEPDTDRVIFSGAVLRSSEPLILPDQTRNYLYEKMKKLIQKVKSKIKSKRAKKENIDELLDLEQNFALYCSKDKYYLQSTKPERKTLLTTNDKEVTRLLQEILSIRELIDA